MKLSVNVIMMLILGAVVYSCGGSSDSGNSDPGKNDPSTTGYAFEKAFLQYRQLEDSANNRCFSWLAITKDGAPVKEADLVGVKVETISGQSQKILSTRFKTYTYMAYNCSGSPCAAAVQHVRNGYFIAFDSLPADRYQVDVGTADGQKVTREIEFPGEVELPLVTSETMQASWEDGDLKLSWTNPSNHADWPKVDQLRLIFFDEEGASVLYVRLNPDAETITIPATLVNQAAELGSGELHKWTVQTRAHDDAGMNFSRGCSNVIALP